jgi:hypothetical protein
MKEYLFTIDIAGFEAELLLAGEWTLCDFAELIIYAVDFDFDHAFEFCDNLKSPYESKERYQLFTDMGEGEGYPGVRKTPVSSVFSPGKEMLFYFDYGDEWLFHVTCTEVKESERKRRFKKVCTTNGIPPVQYVYEDEEDMEEDGPGDEPGAVMKPDLDKIDDAVMALLFLTSFRERGDELARAWKGHDWEALERLHAKGVIFNPVGKAKSLVFTEDGLVRAEAAFRNLFCPAAGPGGS